jgi:GNAT superfamily N-acetyltransferase
MGKGSGVCQRPGLLLEDSPSSPKIEPKPLWQKQASLLQNRRPEDKLTRAETADRVSQMPGEVEWGDMHCFDYGEFRVQPRPPGDNGYSEGKGNFQILFKGEEIGYAERVLELDTRGRMYVRPGLFRLPVEYQKGGLGRAWMQHTEEQYRRAGVDRFEISAIEVGAYAWANQDYVLNVDRAPSAWGYIRDKEVIGEREIKQLCVEQLGELGLGESQHIVNQLVKEGKVSESTARRFFRGFSRERHAENINPRGKWLHPKQIACFGKEESWTEDGEEMWLGKKMLTHRYQNFGQMRWICTWSGVKFFQD